MFKLIGFESCLDVEQNRVAKSIPYIYMLFNADGDHQECYSNLNYLPKNTESMCLYFLQICIKINLTKTFTPKHAFR